MSDSPTTTTIPDWQFNATCTSFSCEEYWTPNQVITVVVTVLRLLIVLLVFMLSALMPKDFLRTFTVTLFVALSLGELFNVYLELVLFLELFQTNIQFHLSFMTWTEGMQAVIQDYIYYDLLVLLVLVLHCLRIATRDRDEINVFPVRTLCCVLQIIPFFLSILSYVPVTSSDHVLLRVIAAIARLVTFVCFVVISCQLLFCVLLLTRELPYTAAFSEDMQIRDARSRIAWFLAYITVPYLTIIPYFVDTIIWTSLLFESSSPSPSPEGDDLSVLVSHEETSLERWKATMEAFRFLVNYYRPSFLVVLTVAFLPPYRRALQILCCCCLKGLKVDPLPRKKNETSLMYRFADL